MLPPRHTRHPPSAQNTPSQKSAGPVFKPGSVFIPKFTILPTLHVPFNETLPSHLRI